MRSRWLAVTLFLLASLVTFSAQAQQQRRQRPFFVGAGLGPAAHVASNLDSFGGGFARGARDVRFRTEAEFGWHPSGDDTGFFLAGNFTFMTGNQWWALFPGIRLGGDIEIWSNSDMAIMLTPSGLAGGGVFAVDGLGNAGMMVLQPAFGGKLVLADGMLQIWVRPATFDFFLYPNWYGRGFQADVVYSFLAGAYFAF